jgi:tRNA(Ile)-lysidine synthase
VASAPDTEPLTDDELAALFGALEVSRGIVIAVSGGSDSTALMHLFARWARRHPEFSNSLVLTVDHGLRPEAALEADLVAMQAKALGLRHATLRWVGDKPHADLQHAARTARYRLLTEAARTEGADTLLTAHTLDDQAETFLLALARGSGVYGLAGMPAERVLNGIRILRPLLPIRKTRLVATLVAASVSWSEDPSNQNDRFRRVTMRQAASGLADIGLTAETLAGTADRLSRAANALDTYADRLIAGCTVVHAGGYLEMDVAKLAAEPEEVVLRALARVLRAMTGAAYVPRLERLERLMAEVLVASSAGERLQRTLAGVAVHLPAATESTRQPRLWLFAEAGRAGFGTQELAPGETLDWNDRIRITLSSAALTPLRIQALGTAARRLLGHSAPRRVPAAALGTLASAWREDKLVAVLGLPQDTHARHDALITATALVTDRLAIAGDQRRQGLAINRPAYVAR